MLQRQSFLHNKESAYKSHPKVKYQKKKKVPQLVWNFKYWKSMEKGMHHKGLWKSTLRRYREWHWYRTRRSDSKTDIPVIRPICRHMGARHSRVRSCSRCGHGSLYRSGFPLGRGSSVMWSVMWSVFAAVPPLQTCRSHQCSFIRK